MDLDICLNMIVKNESHVIKKTLETLIKHIKFSYFVICDTGSTDNTIEIIKDFFASHDIKGEIYIDEWRDFGYNRTLALKRAYKKTKHLFVFDADDDIIGNLNMPAKFEKDAYYINFNDDGTAYKRLLLVDNHLEWIFKGVLHEFIICTNKPVMNIGTIDGNYHITSTKTGARTRDNPQKYLKDAMILEKAFYEAEKANDNIKIRYSFYCAQSHRDNGDFQNAIKWYKKRTEFKEWDQEIYYSYLMIGNFYNKENEFEKAIYYWSLANEVDPERVETIYEIISHFRKLGKVKLAYKYYQMIKRNDNMVFADKLFITQHIYDFLLDYELSIILCYNDKHAEAIDIYHKLFNKNIPLIYKQNLLENFMFYADHFKKNLILNEDYYNFVNKIYIEAGAAIEKYSKLHSGKPEAEAAKDIKIFNEKQLMSMKVVSDKLTGLYKSYDVDMIKSKIRLHDGNNGVVLFSITYNNNFELFEKTINSFIICCKDIFSIDYFFCVDGCSSPNDRNKLRQNFPFFDFYYKNKEETGRKKSMNIIWKKLSEIKPKYWIHIDGDWLFLKPVNYVEKSIKFLENNRSKKISQVQFNKHYGISLESYNRVGGEIIDTDFVLNIKDEQNLNHSNCSKWPHYSMNPSMCITESILEVGDFESLDPFFEKTFANKYTENGYKTAFYNEITCLNISNNDPNTSV